jgi:hypothetical protein
MRVRDAADVSRTRGGVPRRAGGTCITPAEEAAAVRAGGARAVRGAGPGAHLGREWRGRIWGPAARVRGSASSAPAAGRRRPARDDTRGRGCVLGGTHPTRGGVGSRPLGPRTRPPRKVTVGERRVLLLRAARRSARPGVGRGPPAPHRPSLRRRRPRGHAASARATPPPAFGRGALACPFRAGPRPARAPRPPPARAAAGPPGPSRRGRPRVASMRPACLFIHIITVPEIPDFPGSSARQAR